MIKTEKLIGPYLPYEAPTLLPKGSIVKGLNVQKAGLAGGWKPRPGYTLINTTALGSTIETIFQYTNPYQQDYHLFVQTAGSIRDNTVVTGELLQENNDPLEWALGEPLLYEAGADPLAQAASIGASVYDGVGANPGHFCVVGEDVIFANASARPLIYGGSSPFCTGFLVDHDGSGTYTDYTTAVTDQDDDTYAVVPSHASVTYYVCSKQIADGLLLNFTSTVNTNNVTATVKAWRAGAWAAVSGQSDGTTETYTHDQAGTISWTKGADELRVLGNIMGYWYQVTFSGAPTAIQVVQCRTQRDMALMTNKWEGVFEYVTGALFYDQSDGAYHDKLGLVSNTSESQYMDISSATTSDFIYLKVPEKAAGFGFGLVTGNINTDDAQVDQIEYWNGSGWTAITALVDETLDGAADSSFSQAGTIWIDQGEHSAQKRTFEGDAAPGYWYRISWDVALSATCQIAYIVYAGWPDALPAVSGCCEFNGRLVLWGMKNWPNRLAISPYNKPDQFSNFDERLTAPFGDGNAILAAQRFGNYLLVLKAKGAYLMDSSFSITQVASTVGIASPQSLAIAEIGATNIKTEEVVTAAVWQDLDGVYMLSGPGNMRKVSDPVREFFNPLKTDYIGSENINSLSGYISPYDGSYRLILSDKELVYSVMYDEWFPPWQRALTLSCATVVKGTDNRYTIVGGTVDGHLLNLENAASDRDTSNTETAVTHWVQPRAIFIGEVEQNSISCFLRRLYGEFEVSTGTVVVSLSKNRTTTPASIGTMSLVQSGADGTMPHIELSQQQLWCFQPRFTASTIGQEMTIYAFSYVIEPFTEHGR